MSEHTQEPWEVRGSVIFYDNGGDIVLIAKTIGDNAENNANRIVSCVNACSGNELATFKAQRDELLAAVKQANEDFHILAHSHDGDFDEDGLRIFGAICERQASDAIAKIEGVKTIVNHT